MDKSFNSWHGLVIISHIKSWCVITYSCLNFNIGSANLYWSHYFPDGSKVTDILNFFSMETHELWENFCCYWFAVSSDDSLIHQHQFRLWHAASKAKRKHWWPSWLALNSLTPARRGSHFEMQSLSTCYGLSSSALHVKLFSGKWNTILLMTGQHWFRCWLCTVRHQAITCTNIDPDLCYHTAPLSHNELIIKHYKSNLRMLKWTVAHQPIAQKKKCVYRKISNIRQNKSPNSNVSGLVLQLSAQSIEARC